MLDPRSVANVIIQEAIRRGKPVTNLSLQKIMYFVHGRHLLETGTPLIFGTFEAWKYGPVSVPAYDAFKGFGSKPITALATKKDIRTGVISTVSLPDDIYLVKRITDLASPFIDLSAGRLVDLSHAPGSPWDRVTAGDPDRVFGLRMTNKTITDYFRHHKIAVKATPRIGEPDEESPPN
jgi:uncharacterized phage-associated protein